MRELFDSAGDGNGRLLILLPAAKTKPEDFYKHGFIDAVRERKLAFDVMALDAHSDYYVEGKLVERLDAAVCQRLSTGQYGEVWLAGISLGGMGCLAYACRTKARIAGMLLIAPFLGVRGPDRQPELLGTLSSYRTDHGHLPTMYLGYGAQDRYALTSAMLARLLPAGCVTTVDGGHDWPTWSALWDLMLTQAFGRWASGGADS